MAAHEEILDVARKIAATQPDWSFSADDIVRALPHLNPGTVRTHVTSRCCTNAPKNHPHKWDYFKRIARGRYQLLPAYRPRSSGASVAREARAPYGETQDGAELQTIHAAVRHSHGWYSAECLEVAVVTQGRSLDEAVRNLREAIALHLEVAADSLLRSSQPGRLQITYETPLP